MGRVECYSPVERVKLHFAFGITGYNPVVRVELQVQAFVVRELHVTSFLLY